MVVGNAKSNPMQVTCTRTYNSTRSTCSIYIQNKEGMNCAIVSNLNPLVERDTLSLSMTWSCSSDICSPKFSFFSSSTYSSGVDGPALLA